MRDALLELEACTVDLQRNLLVRGDQTRSLTTMERDLLAYLAARPGQAISRDVLLMEVWGYHAGVASRAVDSTVKRLRSKIEVDPAHPSHLIAVFGVGYRFEPGGQSTAGPTAGQLLTNLTEPGDAFVGRAAEIASIEARWSEGVRRITLVGIGGAGKTRAARQWGMQRARGGQEVWFCDLVPARDLAGLLRAVASALGIPVAQAEDDQQVMQRVGTALSDRTEPILILDNAEHMMEAVATVLDAWRAAAPGAGFVVTSRERLRLRGEGVVELDSLQWSDAEALFIQRARQAGVEVDPSDPALRSLVERLDGLPLAIELAAARVNLMTPATLLARLGQGLEALGTTSREMPERHRTLAATIAWSWQLLSADEKDALAQCTVFRGAFSVDAAERVVRAATPILGLLQALRDKSLLRRAGRRLSLLVSVRSFAEQHLEPDARAACEQRHAEWFASQYDPLRWQAAAGWLDVAAIAASYDDFQAVIERCRTSDPDRAARAALALHSVVTRIGPQHTQRALLQVALAAQDPVLRARACLGLGVGDRSGAEWFDRAIEAARAAGSSRLEVMCLSAVAGARARSDDLEGARQTMAKAQRLATELSDPTLLGELAFETGRWARQARQHDQAKRAFEAALGHFGAVSSAAGEACAHYGLGFVALDTVDLAAAEDHFTAAIDAFERVGDERASVLEALLGLVAVERGRLDEGLVTAERSLEHSRSLGDRRMQAEDLFLIGYIQFQRGARDAARDAWEGSLALYRALGLDGSAAIGSSFVAVVEAAVSDAESAQARIRRARHWFEAQGPAHDRDVVEACAAVVSTYLGAPLEPAERSRLEAVAQVNQRVRMALRLVETAGASSQD